MATSGTLDAEERRSALLAALERDGAVRIETLVLQMGVSAMTVRRDLDDLAADGLLRRVRGGAVSASGPRPFSERGIVNYAAKQTIAEKALALVPRSGAISLDASTTAGTVGAHLGARSGLTVITNSVENFIALESSAGVARILAGGAAEVNTGSLVGPIAERAATTVLARRFFMSASAVDPGAGTSEVSILEQEAKRAFAASARDVVLCVDSSKLGHRSVARGFPLSELAVMITELSPEDPRLDGYREQVPLM